MPSPKSRRTRILFVDDDSFILAGLRRLLRSKREDWEMEFFDSGNALLSHLETTPADVVVSDMRMPGMDGEEVLNTVRDRYPKMIRIILSGQSEKEAVFRTLGPAHQYLSKPCEGEVLKQSIDRVCSLRDRLTRPAVSNFLAEQETSFALSHNFLNIIHLAQGPAGRLAELAQLIAGEAALCHEFMEFANHNTQGLSDADDDVLAILRRTKASSVLAMLLAARFFSSVPSADPIQRAALRDRCIEVSHLARRVSSLQTTNTELIEQATVAGLLCNAGRLLIANATQCHRLLSQDTAEFCIPSSPNRLRDCELAAAVLYQWGLPTPIVEAVAWQRNPSSLKLREFSPLVATHIANFWATSPEAANTDGSAQLDEDLLREVGVYGNLQQWRSEISNSLAMA